MAWCIREEQEEGRRGATSFFAFRGRPSATLPPADFSARLEGALETPDHAGLSVGLLITFNVAVLTQGARRLVHPQFYGKESDLFIP
jgi:hypothetical protein